MSYQFKLKKADAPTQLTGFDKRPNWKELASKIANLFHISSPDNVGIAFVDKRTVETINDEDDLREFYSQHPYDTDVKFVVQDLQAPDPAITSTWSKDSNLSDLSKSGSNQLKRLGAADVYRKEGKKLRYMLPSESTLKSLHERLQKINPNSNQYSDPRNMTIFPFPFTGGQLPVDRFDFRESHFKYMGRMAFSELWHTVGALKVGEGYSRLYIQGTMGYGKSHILAVLAGLLYCARKRVVYLPDCRELVGNPMRYMQTALLCAFADPSLDEEREDIRGLESQDDVVAFCSQYQIYFIIDQMNALDYEDANRDTVNNERKAAAQSFLDQLTYGQYRITSASANHRTAMHMEKKQTGEKKLALMGGMSEYEMAQWWIHHDKDVPIFRDKEKARVEDLTGCIPLLLRPLLQFSGKQFHEIEQEFWMHHDFATVGKNVLEFAAEKMQDEPQNYERFYLSTIIGCLTASSVSGLTHKWFDYRYFYADKDGGRCTCGLAREAAAIVIRKGSPGLLCSNTWIQSLRTFKNNPSVVGFIVEQACLSAISTTGFHHGSIKWQSFTATIFKGDLLRAIPPPGNYEAFLIPEDPFFKDIDALYLKVDAEKKIVLVVPIQVTVAKMHKDSEAAFYSQWSNWQEFFRGYELKTAFVWVVENEQSWMMKKEEFRTTRNNSRLISPEHEQIIVTVGDINVTLGRQLAAIRQ